MASLSQKSTVWPKGLHYAVQISDLADGTPVNGTIHPLAGAKTSSFNSAESMGEKGITLSIVDLLIDGAADTVDPESKIVRKFCRYNTFLYRDV